MIDQNQYKFDKSFTISETFSKL